MNLKRRQFIATTTLALAAAGLRAPIAAAAPAGLLERPIPASGEPIPAIGMGTSGSFEVGTDAAARDPLREVLRRFVAGGARLIDTAPSYGTAESVLGDLLAELKLRDQVFLATKLSSVGRDAGAAQFAQSLARLRTDKVELLQVHNLRDWQVQLALARELKAEGKVRYVGLTHYVDSAHAELAAAMRESKPDFIQINYSPTQRAAEAELFPLAQELGIAVLANRNFDDGALFGKVRGQVLPAWAAEVGATSWAQLFLKFVLSHDAVTAVIPATSKPDNQSDNLRAGSGSLLDEAQREALIAAVT
jgi:aryl-alcohol dehydrogenase-like predicted oxidoreductase